MGRNNIYLALINSKDIDNFLRLIEVLQYLLLILYFWNSIKRLSMPNFLNQ